ncbi:cystathionine gamma-synthase [Galactobacter valiniphilus]|uniref:Cystathionine gamma-synthase n=1 Tax=Galactobacter valiniphilus TaxID=2676122 RepID=A0A399JDM9_9MICC|nr:cystathionine gamma-synthase [Galactobacter valiniphilus]RII43673.1 cystathionine gamma-synthase [Galactobacter valiniphilus]
MTAQNTPGFSTRAVHAGSAPEELTGAVIPPLYLSTTYHPHKIGELRGGYDYSRGTNPTRDALQEQLAALEGGRFGISYASGLGAEDAILRGLLSAGDHVVMGNDVYGGTFRLISRIHGAAGIGHTPVDLTDLDAVRGALSATGARLLWVETPSNPMMKIADIEALVALAHEHGALAVVDNTFASPYLQQPLALGADVVVHSTTKYLGGHSDVVGGAVITNDEEIADKVRFIQFAAGNQSSPFDAYLTMRGAKTLGVRMDRHCDNAEAVAQWLLGRPEVSHVLYPGLPDHPGHEVAARQMKRFGGMVSVRLKGGEAAARTVAESTRLFTLAESLGGIESLMNYPSEMTHASVKGTELAVPVDLLRLSVGIEDVEDLLADLEQAFAQL